MPLALPKEAFVALAALSWADDTIRPLERTALLRAARECGVAEGDVGEIEKALNEKVELAAFTPGEMSEWQRVLTYSLGCWLARLDGVLSTEEMKGLTTLAKQLDLAKATTDRASTAAFDIYVLPEGGRPDKFDFVKLVARLKERLPAYAKEA